MPAKNRQKQYLENGYYHLYNRGVEKRKIFLDEQDYLVFLSYLKEYLLPKNEKLLYEKLSDPNISYKEKDKVNKLLKLNNFSDEITLISYCLMSNHFHFFVQQKNSNGIDKFMNSLCTRYTMYFNRKYKRVGSLYQGVYKAVIIENDKQFLHLSRYIHKQAIASQGQALRGYMGQPSSYLDYIGKTKTAWVKPGVILDYFSQEHPSLSYEAFVKEENNSNILKSLYLEEN
jgi:putative transposase